MTHPTQVAGVTFGRYRLIERIARGGMAEVFKAKSFGVEGFEKLLVIKRIVTELAAHTQFVKMFVQEAKLAVQLSHANIVQVFDLGRIDHEDERPASYFIAMEWVPGVDLASVLAHYRKVREPLPLGFAVYVAGEVAKALDHAHRRNDDQGRPLGIVHRDISPSNILLSWEGDVKVTDFGIAKAADTITPQEQPSDLEATRATGKVSFMSPEQSRSEPTDPRSDLFSLGTVVYEMIAGANPFTAPTATETSRRIGVGEYPPLHLSRPEAPTPLTGIIDSLLEARADDRLGSAAELAEQLLAYSYTSGERFGTADLATLLSPLREAVSTDTPLLEPSAVFDEPSQSVEQTPVEIPRASTTPPPAPQSEPEGAERREVTALVVPFGMRGHDPASPELLERIRAVLERHGAWIEELAATQVVAIFGLGDTDGRDADAAVRAGLVLVRERRWGTVPSAGVHSGPISVDDGGIPIADERLANLHASAQSLARVSGGQVVLSSTTHRLVRRSFVTEPLPTSVRALTEGGFVVRGALQSDNQHGRFVGRHTALKKLGGILAAATRHQAQLVAVRGETGLGKSRLLSEAKRRLERGRFNVAFYSASCPLNGASEPWSALRAMLHVLCGTQQDDDPDRILEVRPRLRALGLRNEQADAMLTLLGAPLKASAADTSSILRAGFERMVTSLCEDRLHCFAWDDAQALDRETLDGLLRIMRHHRNLRGAFIVALHGEIPPALAKRKKLHVLALEELGERDTTRLIEMQLGARSIPNALLKYVRSCAGGHPLFIEELLRELCDSGVVQVLNGAVSLRADAQATAPRTLRTLIADRVSRLHQRERRVLQGIAILGEPALTPVLAQVLDQALPSLDRHLSSLESKDLLRRTGPTQMRFASPLYQEIVLHAMPPAVRQELHAAAATTYGQSAVGAVGDTAERIATHLVGAGEHADAVNFYWQSSQEKLQLGQIEAAQRSMLQAIELADANTRDIAELAMWLSTIASTLSQTRKAEGLKEAIAAALREIGTRGDARSRVMAYVDAARALGAVNLFEDAYQALEKANADELGDTDLIRASLAAEAELAGRQGLFVRAVKAVDRLESLGPIDDPDTLAAMALARASSGDCDHALELLDRADQLGKPGDAREAAYRTKHRVLVHFNARDFSAAARNATKLAKLAGAAGLRFEAAAALHNLGDASDRIGDHPHAYAAFVESLELCRQIDHDRLTNLNQMHLCLLDGLRNAEGAEDKLKSHIRYADARGYLWDVLEGRFLLARLSSAHGDHDRARKQLQQVIEIAERDGHGLIGVDAAELLATLEGDG